jgi:hypothetical protein
VIVASGTNLRVSVSVSMPVEKLRSVIGHRNINRPMNSLPSATHHRRVLGSAEETNSPATVPVLRSCDAAVTWTARLDYSPASARGGVGTSQKGTLRLLFLNIDPLPRPARLKSSVVQRVQQVSCPLSGTCLG